MEYIIVSRIITTQKFELKVAEISVIVRELLVKNFYADLDILSETNVSHCFCVNHDMTVYSRESF